MEPARLLRDAAVPRYRRGNEESVKVGQIEALAQKAFGGDDDSMFVFEAGKTAQYRLSFFGVDFSGQENGLVSLVFKQPEQLLGMLFPFRQHERMPTV